MKKLFWRDHGHVPDGFVQETAGDLAEALGAIARVTAKATGQSYGRGAARLPI